MLTPSASFLLKGFKGYIVYGWKRDGKYLYIGQSKQFLRRITSGHHIIGVKDNILPTDQLDLWFCVSLDDLNLVEKSLIKRHEPKFNISILIKSKWNKGLVRNEKRLKSLRRQNAKYLSNVVVRRLKKEGVIAGNPSEDIDRMKNTLSN